jgi:hypothetical protein
VLAAALLLGDVTPERRSVAWSRGLLLGSAGELTAGFLLAGGRALTTGQTHTMAALGDLGLLWGAGAGYLLRFDRRDSVDGQARAMGAATLLGAGLGLGGGYLLGRGRAHTWGDAEVLRTGGLLGGVAGLGIAESLKLDLEPDRRAVTGLALGASMLGAAAADRLVRPLDLSLAEAVLVDLSTLAGGLATAGLAYVLTSDGSDPPPFLLASAIGGVTGFALSYWAMLERSSSRRHGRAAGAGPNVALVPLLSGEGERGAALAGRF